MQDYDVIVIGGGINGLTTAAYLGKAGLKVLVLEERGECGPHCDTIETGIPGFLHNLQATEKMTGVSPCMDDLELDKFGYEVMLTDYAWGKTFLDGKNSLLGTGIGDTLANWGKVAPRDAELFQGALVEGIGSSGPDQFLDYIHRLIFTAPSARIINEFGNIGIIKSLLKKKGTDVTPEELTQMNGFQVMDLLFDSEHIKTLCLSGSWIAGFSPLHRVIGAVGTLGVGVGMGPVFPVHNAKGGSHALPHALIKCAKTYGVEILPCCPVARIIVENGAVKGVKLSEHAVFPGEEISAKKIVSNLTLVPTFIDLIGEDALGAEMAARIKNFYYDENVVFCVNMALDAPPRFASADFDDGIQRCFCGYYGGEDSREMAAFGSSLISGRMYDDELMANWLVPSLTDPGQAPKGCHTGILWLDVPPTITNYNGTRTKGFTAWDDIKLGLAEKMIDGFEKYAPGFRKSIIEKIVLSPLDISRNNQSARKGNWMGGSFVPGQSFTDRPIPGILKDGGSRTYIKNLYLSNSIHPYGATWLASGYIAACEVAEDMGVRQQEWWTGKACRWFQRNVGTLPRNRGVPKPGGADREKMPASA